MNILMALVWTHLLVIDLKKDKKQFFFISKAFSIAGEIAFISHCLLNEMNDRGLLYRLTEL